MAIKITQPGEAKAAAQAGIAVGKAKGAEREEARAEREQARGEQIAARQAARKAALEWEQQKMLLNSQQDFAHEMRMRQAQLDKEARAQEWQVEKMELASRIDFEQDEKERIRRKAEYTAGRDNINENENLTDTQKADANFRLSSRYPDIPEAAAGLGIKPEKQPSISFAAKKAAAKYLEETELGWKERYMPGFLGGRELTETEVQLRAEAEGILTGSVAEEVNIRPESEADFINTVRQLKAVDVNRAKQYYDRYAGSF